MRTVAALIMASSLAVLIWVLHEALIVTVLHPPGLANPTVRLTVDPDFRDILFAMLLVAAISAYCFATITWTERKLQEIRSLIDRRRMSTGPRQPDSIRLLKDAIRAGNADVVRSHARRSALDVIDSRLLTPLELADLYENQDVVDALRAEMERQARRRKFSGSTGTPISSPFALRQTGRSH